MTACSPKRKRAKLTLVFPTTAMAEANRKLQADHDAWESVLLTTGVLAIALSESTAVEIGPWPGLLAAKQVVHEAQALEGVAVTREPEQYQFGSVPLLVV